MDKGTNQVVPTQSDIPANIKELLKENSKHGKELVLMIKGENAHRHEMDKKKMELYVKKLEVYKEERKRASERENRDSWMVFILILLTLSSTVFLIYNDKNVEGSIFGGVALVASMFNRFKKSRKAAHNNPDGNNKTITNL